MDKFITVCVLLIAVMSLHLKTQNNITRERLIREDWNKTQPMVTLVNGVDRKLQAHMLHQHGIDIKTILEDANLFEEEK